MKIWTFNFKINQEIERNETPSRNSVLERMIEINSRNSNAWNKSERIILEISNEFIGWSTKKSLKNKNPEVRLGGIS